MASTYSQSTGSGSSFIPNYPQSAFLQMVASQANAYANQAYSQYDNRYQPSENAIVGAATQDENPAYLAQIGGQASAGAAQAGEAQRTNSLKDLQAFGIDPSGGRYAELDKAERGRTAATQAGASQEAMRQKQSEGLRLSQQVVNTGQQTLDRAQRNQQLAESMKYPPLGQTHTDQSTSGGGSGGGGHWPTDPSGGGRDSSGAPYNPGQDSGSNFDPAMSQSGGNDAEFMPVGTDVNKGTATDMSGPAITDYSSHNNLTNGGQSDPLSGSYGGYDTGGVYNPGATDTGGVFDPNASFGGLDPNASSGGFGGGDNSGYTGFAQGGAIDVQGGGNVPQSASPSNGQQTDDIQANVNADEFVVPKDVALWKGQEFFQKLIATARKARLAAPAHGTPEQPAMG